MKKTENNVPINVDLEGDPSRIYSARSRGSEISTAVRNMPYPKRFDTAVYSSLIAQAEDLASSVEKGCNGTRFKIIALLAFLALGTTGIFAEKYSPEKSNEITLSGNPDKDAALKCAKYVFDKAAGCSVENISPDDFCTPQMIKDIGGSVMGAINFRDEVYNSGEKWKFKKSGDEVKCFVE